MESDELSKLNGMRRLIAKKKKKGVHAANLRPPMISVSRAHVANFRSAGNDSPDPPLLSGVPAAIFRSDGNDSPDPPLLSGVPAAIFRPVYGFPFKRDFTMRDFTTVRDFLFRATYIEADLIDALIQKGGVTTLEALKSLTEDDLTHPDRSIIAPRVIPKILARMLIQLSIPHLCLRECTSSRAPMCARDADDERRDER